MKRPTTKALHQEAQIIASDGQPVFPCHIEGTKAKRPWTQQGFKDATTDPDQITRWWKTRKRAAIGIPTGIVWDVLDVDVKGADGRVHLPYLQRIGLLDGCKRVVRTPSGGYHLYFLATPGLKNAQNPDLGLDVRATGGYVLAPLSFVDDGEYSGIYEDLGEVKDSTDEPLMWEEICNALQPVNAITKEPVDLPSFTGHSGLGGLKEFLLGRKEGERNRSLFWASCRCVEAGIDPHELLEVAVEIGLEDDEIEATFRSAMRSLEVNENSLRTEAEGMFGDD